MNQSACNAGDEKSIVNLELNGVFQRLSLLLQHAIETFSLRNCPWEAIQNESVVVRTVHIVMNNCGLPIGTFSVIVKLFLDHGDHNVVAH